MTLLLLPLMSWDVHEGHHSRRDVDDGGGVRVRASDGKVRAGWPLVRRRRGCRLNSVAIRERRDQGRDEVSGRRSGGKPYPDTGAVEIDLLLALLVS